MADVKVLVIDRSKWLRGGGNGNGRLLSDGKMCCLGFFGRALGISDETLDTNGTPQFANSGAWPGWLLRHGINTEACRLLTTTNDDDEISDAAREREVAAEFARHGVEVRFVDGTEQPRAAPSSPPDPSTEIR